ncbi:MAG: glycosyltransferase family 4 protein [Actinomycetota bacterium]
MISPPPSSAMPRVVIVGPWWRPLPPVRDGAPEWVIEHTVRRLRTLRPLMVSPWHPDVTTVKTDPSRYHYVRPGLLGRVAHRLPYRVSRRLWGTSDPHAIPYVHGLGRVLRRLRPEVVVTHVLPGLALAARSACPEARVIHYSHTYDLHEARPAEWRSLTEALDGLVTVCDASLRALQEKHGELPFPARVILNGVDLEALHPDKLRGWRAAARAELGLGKGPVFAFCGRLHPRKGADLLLNAFRSVREAAPDAQLLLIGASTHMGGSDADPHTRDLIASARACGQDAVRFAGYVPSPRLGRVLAAADIGVLPSVEPEGMPLSILEFAACGLPVVASDVGGVGEVIRDGIEGLLLPPDRLAAGLDRALLSLARDSSLRERMGHAARRRAELEFGWDRVAADFERMLQDFQTVWTGVPNVRDRGRLHLSAGSSRAPGGRRLHDGADAPARTR